MHARSVRTLGFGLSLIVLVSVVSAPASAATPNQGRLNATTTSLKYVGGPFTAPNRTDPLTGDGSTQQCALQALPCDDFAVTVALPAGYVGTHPDARVRVELASDNGSSDYDLYVLDQAGNYITVGYNAGDKESVEFPAADGSHAFTVRAVPFSSNAGKYTAKLSLLSGNPKHDADGDKVADVVDWCPTTPKGVRIDVHGCQLKPISMPSAPKRPRVVVADLDSAINPYHEFYYQRPSVITKEILAEFGVKPQNVVRLTRTANFAADIAADAGFWSRVRRDELYHFVGTNIIATSLAGVKPYLKPVTAKDPHGTGTSSAVLTANPDAVLFFVEANDQLGSAKTHAAAFKRAAVDIVTTSYGASFASGLVPAPEYRAFEHTYEGVVKRGKLHFSSGGNGPGLSALRSGAGPWWSIGVSGIEEDSSNGDTALSGNLSDFVSDFTQPLPYCVDCESGKTEVSGTSFSTPRSAGLASNILLQARRKLGHAGGIRKVNGVQVMATNGRVRITNWDLRRALEQAAWTPDSTSYDPAQAPEGGVGLPIVPGTPWVQTGWGDLTTKPSKGVIKAALAELGFGGATRLKAAGYCEGQTATIAVRKTWWDTVAPTLPDNPELTGETPPGPPKPDPFVYC